jgi:hypothetical protein
VEYGGAALASTSWVEDSSNKRPVDDNDWPSL